MCQTHAQHSPYAVTHHRVCRVGMGEWGGWITKYQRHLYSEPLAQTKEPKCTININHCNALMRWGQCYTKCLDRTPATATTTEEAWRDNKETAISMNKKLVVTIYSRIRSINHVKADTIFMRRHAAVANNGIECETGSLYTMTYNKSKGGSVHCA